MKIYTSYFANIENLEKAGLYCVAICNKVPGFFKGPNIGSVAPSDSILNQFRKSAQTDDDKEVYRRRYINEILCAYRFHPEELTNLLQYFSDTESGKDIALICYERPEDFCHRHILADWLNERLDYGIMEYPVYPEKKTKKPKEDTIIKVNTLF